MALLWVPQILDTGGLDSIANSRAEIRFPSANFILLILEAKWTFLNSALQAGKSSVSRGQTSNIYKNLLLMNQKYVFMGWLPLFLSHFSFPQRLQWAK